MAERMECPRHKGISVLYPFAVTTEVFPPSRERLSEKEEPTMSDLVTLLERGRRGDRHRE